MMPRSTTGAPDQGAVRYVGAVWDGADPIFATARGRGESATRRVVAGPQWTASSEAGGPSSAGGSAAGAAGSGGAGGTSAVAATAAYAPSPAHFTRLISVPPPARPVPFLSLLERPG
jgi:hypothetical protein